MYSAASLQSSGLVRTKGSCAQTQGGHGVNERREVPCGLFFFLPVDGQLNSKFKQNKNVATAHIAL